MLDRQEAAENYVRDALRIMGHEAEADDPKFVRRIVVKLLRAMPKWIHEE